MELPCASEVTRRNLMLPPPSGTFQAREDLIKHVRDFGVSQGYVVTIKKSKRDRRVILGCDRGGIYRNRRKMDESKRKRKASSRLINCPFEAIGKKDDDAWVLTIKNGEHNHEPLKDISEHPYSRRFTEEEVQQIKLLTEAGVKPRQVLKALKQSNPDLQSTPRHLYNVKAKIRQGLSEKSLKSWRPNLAVGVSTSTEKSTCIFPLKVANYIGGNFSESLACEVIDVINPATQEVVSQVPMTTYEEFKAAVVAAKQAFPAWKNTPVSTRQRIMFKLQELICRDIDKIVMNITIEQGKTLNGARGDVLYGLELVERACGMATLQMGKYVPDAANGIDTFCTREPLGVCAGICLSDFSAMIPIWMFPIAVACGNTFILKPSEKNPGASMMIAALAAEAGLPDGVLNIVHGNHEIVNNICDDEDMKAISLISSNTAGMHIFARAAGRGKRIQSNIEVKNHIIVMPDASADAALDAILASGFGASGIQKFMRPSIAVFVGGSTPWEEELVERAKLLKVNAGTEAGTDIGPVISKEAKDQICRLVQNGIHNGARLVLDGRHIVETFIAFFYICQAENLEEAIAIVNNSNRGNGASLFTSSCHAARKFQNEVETSLVGINVPLPFSLPFSMYNGSNSSISGDLNFVGKAGVHFYTQVRAVVQQWKELPRRRVSLPYPPTSQTGMSSEGISIAQLSASEKDLHDSLVSTAMPSAVTELPSHNVSLSFPSPAEDEPLLVPSTSKQDPTNQEVSIVIGSATPADATGQVLSTSMPSTSDRMFSSQTSQWGETPITLQTSENMLSSSESRRIDMRDNNVTSAERFYIRTRNESMGMMMSFTHGMHQTDANLHPISERAYLPLMSQQNENVVPTSQRPLQSTPNPDSVCLSMSQRNDDVSLISLNANACMHHASSGSLNAVCTCNMVRPQTTNSVPQHAEKTYLPSPIQRNNGASSSLSERLFIPSTSQEIYGQTPKISMEEYHNQGVL